MATRLTAVGGPLRKSEFAIELQLTIGSGPENGVRLEDAAVSPEHCWIGLVNGRAILSDLGSHTGTFVNGITCKLRELKTGDEIGVGSSLFVFHLEKEQPKHAGHVEISEQDSSTGTATELHPEELLALEPESLAALPRAERLNRNLSALQRICRGIASLRDEESLPWQLLGMIFEVIPAERGAVLLTEEGSLEVRAEAAWDRTPVQEKPVHVSGELIRRVLEEGTSLQNGGEVKAEGGGAVLCVPIPGKVKTVGLIYLESRKAVFTQDDFQLLAAIASLAAIVVEKARQVAELGSENERLRAEVSLTHDMVGRSARMREVYQFIERVAPSDSTVLIRGESGTGKELVAGAIHKNSSRKHQPFVALNCAALTETLLESELFGHEKGAFTSAVSQKKGFLEVAEGGTIFLDEIGELSLVLQAKLLRVLQEREFVRVGGTRPIKINVRFLAATNRDLQKWVREEKFRGDLFHRLNVISIHLPALREHAEDIPVLAEYFAARHAKKCSRTGVRISEAAMACLKHYDWPGNVRELENALERAVVIGSSDCIVPEDLPETMLENAKNAGSAPAQYHDAVLKLKKQLILGALEQASGNITEAAKLLGVHANYLHRLIRNLELRPLMKKQAAE